MQEFAVNVEKLPYVTVRIEVASADGDISVGTGFFYNANIQPDRYVPLVITNKHVVSGAKTGKIRFHAEKADSADSSGSYSLVMDDDDFESKWVMHGDNDTDLAAFPCGGTIIASQKHGYSVLATALSREIVADQKYMSELSGIEPVLMIGYPNGLWDTKHNLPIIRRGITATPPKFDFNGKSEFVIDCACFPGSSGSPVFLHDTGSTIVKDGKLQLGAPRFRLLGILHAGPQISITGEIEPMPIPTSVGFVAKSQMLMHLGYCIKAHQLFWFDEYFQKKIDENPQEFSAEATRLQD